MAAPLNRSFNPAIREVTRGLAGARDQQIMQVVSMVDAMPNRGPADQLIAPLRVRLARLRPPRPLRFARLLFMPLDPLIVPPARWRLEQATIPRTAIPLLAESVAAALGTFGPRVAAMIEGSTTNDRDVVEAAGRLLWRHAGALLLDASPPAGWEATGLGFQVHKPLSRRIGALLSQAEQLGRMTADAAQGLPPPDAIALHALLAAAISHDSGVQPMLVALLLAQVPECAPVLSRVANLLDPRGGVALRHAGEQAADILLDQLEAPGGAEGRLGGQSLAEAGAAVHRLTSLLSALDGETLSPERRARLHGVRERVVSGCQSLFTERLAVDFLDPLRARVAGSGPKGAWPEEAWPEEAWEFETAARGLRTLETEARQAGGGKTYDVMLGQAADLIRDVIGQGGLDRVEGLRLMEIVAGPEAALALLDEAELVAGFGS
jgi:hypothetical protein